MSRSSRAKNLSYAALAGLAGCGTVVFTVAALLLGLWLDAQTGTRGPFTIILLLASVPISLTAMVWLTVWMVKRIRPSAAPRKITEQEEG